MTRFWILICDILVKSVSGDYTDLPETYFPMYLVLWAALTALKIKFPLMISLVNVNKFWVSNLLFIQGKYILIEIFLSLLSVFNPHCVKRVLIRRFSGPYYAALKLNTEIYSVNLRIQSKWGIIRTRKTSQLGTFYAVPLYSFNSMRVI